MIIHGDSLKELKALGADSIDFICTDPPYGYSFMGKDWDKAVPSVEVWKECLRVLKPGAFCCVMSAPRSDVQCAMISRLQEAGFRLDFTPIYWTYASGFPKAANIGKLVDKRKGLERKGAGTRGNTFSLLNPIYETGEPLSAEAKALDGSYAGFQPKPAVEVIIVAMKPLSEKTFVDQALKNGKGISWLDAGRMPYVSEQDLLGRSKGLVNNSTTATSFLGLGDIDSDSYINPNGRFPANLLVSDDVLDAGVNDSGPYSRYFSLDKWASTLPFLTVSKATAAEKSKGLNTSAPLKANDGRKVDADNAFQRGSTLRRNSHPTVKPLKLMTYLIVLFSREGDTILDPFVGSGTTVIAAAKLNRKGIGIEREVEYVEIARAREAAVEPQLL